MQLNLGYFPSSGRISPSKEVKLNFYFISHYFQKYLIFRYFLQRIWGILYMVGSPIDFWIRLYGPTTFTHIVWKMEMENYCPCWMIIYKSMFYASMTCQVTVAVIRYTCVVYPIENHSRSAENVFLLCSEYLLAGTQMRRQEHVSFKSFVCWLLFLHSLSLGLSRPVIIIFIFR